MEDKEIKRLLSLRANPHFQVSPSEMEKVREWEKAQKKIEIKEVEKLEAPEGFEYSNGIGTEKGPSLIPKKKRNKKTKNIVKAEEKEIGDIEEN